MTEPERMSAIEAMCRSVIRDYGETFPIDDEIQAKRMGRVLRALLDGGYVVLTEQLEEVGECCHAWPTKSGRFHLVGQKDELTHKGYEGVVPVFRLSSESPDEPR